MSTAPIETVAQLHDFLASQGFALSPECELWEYERGVQITHEAMTYLIQTTESGRVYLTRQPVSKPNPLWAQSNPLLWPQTEPVESIAALVSGPLFTSGNGPDHSMDYPHYYPKTCPFVRSPNAG